MLKLDKRYHRPVHQLTIKIVTEKQQAPSTPKVTICHIPFYNISQNKTYLNQHKILSWPHGEKAKK